ncbi:alpha-amylase family glycosyl hydrolase, partial [Bacteroides heparinolyticus]|uniref:alpha-amylase family glycosyl hydrolase n=1 Tax=Prevotella heparinolytica TaxID=28113 RepID=UPI0035A0D73A
MNAKNNGSIDRIEPTNWFVGMKDKSLQIMVYGKNIKTSQVKVSYPGVRIDSVVRLDSPNYLLIYLNLGEAKAGKMKLNFYNYDKAYSVDYELKERTMPGEAHKGFDNSDVLYMLMPDRFANGNPKNDVVKGMADETCNRNEPSLRHGGDLKGIADHLDYFTDLGVTALWFTPVLENDMPADQGKFSSYHGYATTNYYKIDPRFGTNDEYKQLISECHRRGLKVVMDMIFNHCGSNHPWNKDMPSKDWFNHPHYGMQTSYKLNPVLDPYASKIDLEETTDGWFVRTMPDLNQRNPHVIKY